MDEVECAAEMQRQQRRVEGESERLQQYVDDYMEFHFGPRRITIEEFNNLLESDDDMRDREQRVEDELQGLAEFYFDRIVIVDPEGRVRND